MRKDDLSYYLKNQNGFGLLIENFFKYLKNEKLKIYNEFSFQYELGIYLRKLDKNKEYKIEFERNIKTVLPSKTFENLIKKYEKDVIEGKTKREIDIYIENKNTKEQYAIELKFPKNGAYPDEMLKFLSDMKFMQILKNVGFTKTFCVTIVGLNNEEIEEKDKKYNPKLFYEGKPKEGHIFRFFRNYYDEKLNITYPLPITGKINISDKENSPYVQLGNFNRMIEWLIPYKKEDKEYYNELARYYVIEIDNIVE